MENARWQQIEHLYFAALEQSPAERAAFLARECADDEALRREVTSLISADDETGDFLNDPDFELGLSLLARTSSRLHAGQEFGDYAIVRFIGRGGMGEVYLAKDGRLKRQVALKLLPEQLIAESQFTRRFEHEARIAASLAHPHIAHIYEIGEHDAQRFIAMEYVAGVTLRERLRDKKPLPQREALRIAAQVASGLAAAHEAGIIHRDIKPENIMVRPDGFIKILDFGLAKLSKNENGADDEAGNAASYITEQGLILGTTRYMSPEQARGQAADARTDVWSLGVVLYEMLTGEPPFAGATTSDIIAEILKAEPSFIKIDADVKQANLASPLARQVLERAMRKNADERYESASEMQRDLHFALDDLTNRNENLTTHRHVATTSGARSFASRRTLLITLLFASLIIGAAAFNFYQSDSGFITRTNELDASSSSSSHTFTTHAPLNLTATPITQDENIIVAAMSPDARSIAYAREEQAGQGVWLRDVETGATRVIVPSSSNMDFEGGGLAFSPDGAMLYYTVFENDSLDGTLYRVNLSNPAPEALLRQIDNAVSFAPDGKRIAYFVIKSDHERLMIADVDGANQREITRRRRPQFLTQEGHPAWSPDGKRIAFAEGLRAAKRQMNIVIYDLTTERETELFAAGWADIRHLAWLPDGGGLVMTARESTQDTKTQLYRVAYPNGEVTPLTDDQNAYAGISLARHANGEVNVLTSVVKEKANIFVLDDESAFDGAKARQVTDGEDANNQGIAWTSDGRIVYGSNAGGKGYDIWITDADGNHRHQLTDDAMFDSDPDVTPDNRFVIFSSPRGGGVHHLWRASLDGSNLTQLTSGMGEYYPNCSPLGGWIVYHRLSAGDSISVWKITSDGGAPVQLTSKSTTRAVVSPDGNRVVSTHRPTSEEGAFSLIVYPLNGARDETKLITPLPGARLFIPARWSADGRSIIYVVHRDGADNLWRHSLEDNSTYRLTRFTTDSIYAFDLSTDGKRVALARGNQTTSLTLLTDK
ncbi:MAG: protein kinase [Pyrinomonadaceae bacterium MAG19_C2-C3]|nr:protein kinase [Pyrinomonadaceae bacterium MAG19_C2-C3]